MDCSRKLNRPTKITASRDLPVGLLFPATRGLPVMVVRAYSILYMNGQ